MTQEENTIQLTYSYLKQIPVMKDRLSKRKEVCFLTCTGGLSQNSDSVPWLRSLLSEAATIHFRKATKPRRVVSGFRDKKAVGRCIWAGNVDPLVRHLNGQACTFSLSQGPLVFMNLCSALKQHRGTQHLTVFASMLLSLYCGESI